MRAPERTVVSIEVGGTSMRAARYHPETRSVSARRVRDTPAPAPDESIEAHQARVLTAITGLAHGVLGGVQPDAVGLAYPGPVDAEGRVLAAPTVLRRTPGEPFDLAAACAVAWPGATVLCANDLTAAGWHYVDSGLRDFAVVTVGSGIGHKIFLEGVPRVGAGRGGEMGHLRLDYDDDAPPCDCGGRGHLGGLASGRGTVGAVRRRARSHPADHATSSLAHLDPDLLDGPDVAAAFRAGDAFTVAAVTGAVRYLGQALAAMHLDVGVERIIVVGGFAAAMGEAWRRLVVEAATAATWEIGQVWDDIVVLGERAEDAALLGMGAAVSAG